MGVSPRAHPRFFPVLSLESARCSRFAGHLSHPGASCRRCIPDLPDILAICTGSGRLLRVKRTTVPPTIESSALNEAACPWHFHELSDNRARRTGLVVCLSDKQVRRTGLVACVSDNPANTMDHFVFVSLKEASERVHLADLSDNPPGETPHVPAMRGRETRTRPLGPHPDPLGRLKASPAGSMQPRPHRESAEGAQDVWGPHHDLCPAWARPQAPKARRNAARGLSPGNRTPHKTPSPEGAENGAGGQDGETCALPGSSGGLGRPLAVIPGQDPPDGQVLVQLGPVEAERRELDVIERRVGLVFQPGIPPDGKRDLQTALHRDVDPPVLMAGRDGLVNQGAHATYGL